MQHRLSMLGKIIPSWLALVSTQLTTSCWLRDKIFSKIALRDVGKYLRRCHVTEVYPIRITQKPNTLKFRVLPASYELFYQRWCLLLELLIIVYNIVHGCDFILGHDPWMLRWSWVLSCFANAVLCLIEIFLNTEL